MDSKTRLENGFRVIHNTIEHTGSLNDLEDTLSERDLQDMEMVAGLLSGLAAALLVVRYDETCPRVVDRAVDFMKASSDGERIHDRIRDMMN